MDVAFGRFLRERRARLDASALGYPSERRRTPGLRREEVAQRANISVTWYSWLEQGRGGAPSADVLDRVSRALMLTDVEREHLFLLGLGRLPDVRYRSPGEVTPRLQRLLDAMDATAALMRTVSWDVVAWNAAAAAMLTDYGTLPASERNILRLMFLDPLSRERNLHWNDVARFIVGVFRAEASRKGASKEVQPLVEELRHRSPDFASMWDDGEVLDHGAGLKYLRHPLLGAIEIEYSSFAVQERPDLTMLVYNPLKSADVTRIRSLIAAKD